MCQPCFPGSYFHVSVFFTAPKNTSVQFESEKSEDAVNLDLCNSQSGTDKMLQLKGRNTSQATLESSASNFSGDTVPTIIVVILIQSLHCPLSGVCPLWGWQQRGQWAQGHLGTALSWPWDRGSPSLCSSTSCTWSWAQSWNARCPKRKRKLFLVFNRWLYVFFNLFLSWEDGLYQKLWWRPKGRNGSLFYGAWEQQGWERCC